MNETLEDISQNRILTREEEIALARRIQQGDEQARTELFNSNLRLINYLVVKKFKISLDHPDYANYFNTGLIALDKAVKLFDPDRGFKFSTCASKFIINEILKEFYSKKNRITTINLYEENEGGEPITDLIDNFPHDDGDPYKAVEKKDLIAIALQELENLDERSQRVIECRYLSQTPLTLEQIGSHLGLGKERIRQIEAEALKKLRKYLLTRGIEFQL